MASKSNIALPGRIEVFAGKEAENPILTRWMSLPVAVTPTMGPRRAGTTTVSVSLTLDEDGLKRAAAQQLRVFAAELDPPKASVFFVAPERSGPDINGEPLTIKEDTWAEHVDGDGEDILRSGRIYDWSERFADEPFERTGTRVRSFGHTLRVWFVGDEQPTDIHVDAGETLVIRTATRR